MEFEVEPIGYCRYQQSACRILCECIWVFAFDRCTASLMFYPLWQKIVCVLSPNLAIQSRDGMNAFDRRTRIVRSSFGASLIDTTSTFGAHEKGPTHARQK